MGLANVLARQVVQARRRRSHPQYSGRLHDVREAGDHTLRFAARAHARRRRSAQRRCHEPVSSLVAARSIQIDREAPGYPSRGFSTEIGCMSGFLTMLLLALTHDSTRDWRGVRRWALVAALTIAATTAAPALHAQVLSGTVRDSASQQPLPNTRVLALDPAGRTTASVNTDQQGRFRISPWTSRAAARTGTVRIRALRMGFRPTEFTVNRSSAATPVDVPLVSFPIVLEEFQVMAASCPKRA